jgi:hypothetical protein
MGLEFPHEARAPSGYPLGRAFFLANGWETLRLRHHEHAPFLQRVS